MRSIVVGGAARAISDLVASWNCACITLPSRVMKPRGGKGSAPMTKAVLITGCSTGIGRAAAHLFASRGWGVTATMRRPEDAGDLAAAGDVRVEPLDVVDLASVDRAVARTLEAFGRLDVVVNNAGFGAFGPFETAPEWLIERQIGTNLIGVFNVTRAALPTMRAQKSGVIVNVSSIGGLTTFPLNSIYHATKYAIVGFTEGVTYELEPFGIRAKVVAPGGVATDFVGRSLSLTFQGDGGPYADAIAKVMATFRKRAAGGQSKPEAIAEVIFEAATDNLPRVRYVAGPDAIALLERRASMTDEAYIKMTRDNFGLSG
jgi:NAD(P)-dependent dehydrogenase (short-subunit alcohol dehydrogenase family)